jgi:glutathione peroxidase
MSTVHDYTVTAADGSKVSLDQYQGKTLLLVNVASKCGLTPQYEGLERLYEEKAALGLEIIGFPCNQFGDQEPGTDAEIQEFCSLTYNVTFPVMGKIDVNGPGADPLFVHLRAADPGDFGPHSGGIYEHIKRTRPEAIGTDEVKWNFTKFLVGPDGAVIKRYAPGVTPEEISADLVNVLG